jgi:glycosyltransferase involved in cell wall biosynthesis
LVPERTAPEREAPELAEGQQVRYVESPDDGQVAGAVSAAIARLLADPELRARLGSAGIETAREYAWERRIDALEAFFQRVAASRRMALAGELAPAPSK